MRLSLLAVLLCACGSGLRPHGTGGGAGGGATGGSGGSGTGGGGGTIIVEGLPLSSACSTLNAKRCEYYVKCGLIDDTPEAKRDCAAWLLVTWCGPTRWPARVEAGTLLYDGKNAKACAEAWALRSCQDYETLPGVCNRITSPNVSPLHSCYDGYAECTESLVCRGAACPRTCQQPGAPGDVCQLDSDCRQLLYCKRTVTVTGTGTCTNMGSVNSLCSKDEPCTAGLSCAGGKCIAPPTAGAYCATGGLCDDTSWCQFSPDGGVCASKEGSGAMCTDDVQCMSGYLCQLGRCEPRVLALIGSPCSDRQLCPTLSTCVGATTTQLGACANPLLPGDACVASDDCEKHLACAPVDGGLSLACARRQPNQASCTLDRDCQLLSRCKSGVCMRLPELGQSCVEEQACVAGPCVAAEDGGFFCGEKFAAGSRCSFDGDCTSGRCLGNICLPACAP